MAGQGLQRREILRVIGVAALASHFPGFTRWAYAGAHGPGDTAPPKPQSYAPQFFSVPDFDVISRLSELIIPSDETPGAREAGVCEFVDFMVYVCDASVFPNPTDKTTTLSILTFSLRTSEHLLQNFNRRVHRRA